MIYKLLHRLPRYSFNHLLKVKGIYCLIIAARDTAIQTLRKDLRKKDEVIKSQKEDFNNLAMEYSVLANQTKALMQKYETLENDYGKLRLLVQDCIRSNPVLLNRLRQSTN
jgi:hypothetical protein